MVPGSSGPWPMLGIPGARGQFQPWEPRWVPTPSTGAGSPASAAWHVLVSTEATLWAPPVLHSPGAVCLGSVTTPWRATILLSQSLVGALGGHNVT